MQDWTSCLPTFRHTQATEIAYDAQLSLKSTMLTYITQLCAYLSYREPYTRWNGVEDIKYRYYSIGACLLAVSIVVIVAVTIAFTVASFEPQD